MPHFLLTYDLAPEYMERRGAYRDEHLTLAWDAAGRGDLILGGAVGEPVESAMLVFANPEAAEAFAAADPYVSEGLVRSYRVIPWNTVVGEGASSPVRPA